MTIRVIRLFFLLLSMICGYYLGYLFLNFSTEGGMIGSAVGLLGGAFMIFVESKLERVSIQNLSASAFGLAFGFFMAWLTSLILRLVPIDEGVYSSLKIILTLIFCYLGMIIAVKGKDEFNIVIPYVRFSREDRRDQVFLLDTSVIIDGRIAGIFETGFLEGKVVVPRFVLNELHQVADSADDLKRTRGRRGLDMLENIKSIKGMSVVIHEEGLSEIKEVDAKLVRMAKMLDCPIVTNDFNLNKVARIEGVAILNINDLSNALRPIVFPGEKINVYIKKEGKERNQGIAFMDDGTMIVVENGKKLIGKNIKVSVSSVLQTSAGKMIFANAVNGVKENKE
ncbi:MAG: PIN domain nuclease [Candidatus Omnitrophica bacterium]|nr:PIN domain nuclease [Candidatus Omnitrophota bacterium]